MDTDNSSFVLLNWTSNPPPVVITATSLSPAAWQERVTTTIIFVTFGSVGILLNMLPLFLTFCTDLRKKRVHIMVANLSTADLLFCVSFVFGQTQYILYRESIDFTACRWLAFFTFTTAIFEFLFPPMLALNRYVSLYHKEMYDRIYTRRNIGLLTIGCWIFAMIIPLIFTLSGKTAFDDDNMHCCIVVKHGPIGWMIFYWLVIVVPLVAFCDGTMLFCNYKIYKKLFLHQATSNLKNNVVRENRELLYFLVADMMFPILFHTTYHVAKFASIDRIDLLQRRTFTVLYLINSCVRGLVTLTMLRPYRESLKKLLGRVVMCKHSIGGAVVPVMTSHGVVSDRQVVASGTQG